MHLPDDCLSYIFQWLDCGSDRDSFGMTCHRWLNIQNINRRSLQFQCSLSVLNIPSLSQTNLEVTASHLYRLLIRYQHLQHLSLSGCTEVSDSGLALLQSYGSKLESLYLDCCFNVTDNGLSSIANGCPSLKVISLYRCEISDVGLGNLANACLALTHVNLSHCLFVYDSGLRALSQQCRQLKAIKMSNCRQITGVGLNGCSPTLVYIAAESCKLDPEGISGIVSGGGLKFLDIYGISWLPRDGLAALGAGFCAKLKILNLGMCRTIGDESIAAIAKGCPLLEEWNLSLCREVRTSGWESIGVNCHYLERLHVNRCWNLCDRGLQALRDGCKKLSVLYMSGNNQLSAVAVELFKAYRSDVEIRAEEIMIIVPDWTSIKSE